MGCCREEGWCREQDSNLRGVSPADYKSAAINLYATSASRTIVTSDLKIVGTRSYMFRASISASMMMRLGIAVGFLSSSRAFAVTRFN